MTRPRSRRLTCAASCILAALGSHPYAERPDARASFQRGLSALHQFEYEDANDAFREARQIDPGFALAYWGEAMTFNQTLWRHEDVRAARQALAHLGPTPASRRAKAATPRDQGLIAAVDTLFGDGDAQARHQRYAEAMGRLYAGDPDDPDVASLYGLALLGTMSRSLIGYEDSHEGHSVMLAGSETQTQVGALLEKVLRSHPDHPGALHYLLHNDDDPQHAHMALAAARTLARLAPDASHALHMPSHIFLQLGLWHDAASSDRAAFAASSAWVARKHLDAAMRNYHALSWFQYELLQLGRYREAWAVIGELAPVVEASGQLTLLSDLSTMRARYVIETANWQLMARETNFGNVNELCAIGLSAARGGNASLAERARQGLADRARDPREGDLRPAIAIMEREVAAAIALAGGRGGEAVGILQRAARSEAQLPPPLGLPEPVKPAPELLGEALIELGRPAEAVAFFEQALLRNANRSRSVLGLAHAAGGAGDPDAARRHYRAFLANFDHADPDLPVLVEARAALGGASLPPPRFSISVIAVVVAAIGVVVLAVLIWSREKRAPAGRLQSQRRVHKKRARFPGP